MAKSKLAIASAVVLLALGVATATPVIRHAKVSSKPAPTDSTLIGGPDWNADHVIDPVGLLAAEGIAIVTANPNGTSGTMGALSWDQTNAQLYINTTGGTVWTPFVRADGGTAPAPLSMYIRGDSNGFGKGTETDMDDPSNNVSVPNANVVFQKIGGSANWTEPYTPTVMASGPLRILGFSPAHGPELTIGLELNNLINGIRSVPVASRRIWLDDMTISSTKLADWIPSSTSGNGSPLLGGSNLFADSKNRAVTQAATSGRRHTVEFNTLGGNDASDNTAATNVTANVAAYIAQRRADLGSQLLFVWGIFQSTIPAGTFPFVTTARNNLINALSAIPGVALVFAEDLPTNDDQVHYTSVAEDILGERMAAAYQRLAGIPSVTVTRSTVVGISDASWNGSIHGLTGITGAAGSNLRVFPWQLTADGDTMVIPVFTVNPSPGTTIPTPTGWSAAVTQLSSNDNSSGTSRVALFTRNLAQSELDGNSGNPISVTFAPGGNTFVGKPFTVRGTGRFPTVIASASFTAPSGNFTTSAVTAPGVTTTSNGQTVYVLVSCWDGSGGQSFTVTNGNLTNLTQLFGGVYPCASGASVYMGLWEGAMPTAGATGNSTITFGVGAPACNPVGLTWAM